VQEPLGEPPLGAPLEPRIPPGSPFTPGRTPASISAPGRFVRSFGSPLTQSAETLAPSFPCALSSPLPESRRRRPVSSSRVATRSRSAPPPPRTAPPPPLYHLRRRASPRRIAVCELPPLCVVVHSSRCFPSAILILIPTSRRRRRPYLGVAAHLRVHVPIQECSRHLDLQQHHLGHLLGIHFPLFSDRINQIEEVRVLLFFAGRLGFFLLLTHS
jgi:hypothetical protein